MINRFIKEFTILNSLILIFSLLFFFPVAPLGLLLASFWGWLCITTTDKKTAIYLNFLIILIFLVIICYFYDVMFILYSKKLWELCSIVFEKRDFFVLVDLFKSWYSNYAIFKMEFSNLKLEMAIFLQSGAIVNAVLLRSSEILHKIKDEKSTDKSSDPIIKDGIFLGIEVNGNIPIIIPDSELNGHLFVAGTTGSGKTVSLKNIIWSAIERGIPVIYLDGKGDQKLPSEMQKMCLKAGREFKLFEMNPNSQVKYNPLSVGGFTELKDKIITMKTSDNSASSYYQTAEGEYLQFLFKVLKTSGKHIDLYALGSYITMPRLFELVGAIGDSVLQYEARELKERLGKSLDGLISDINTFVRSELGHLFNCKDGDTVIDLDKDIKNGTVLYFSLNDLNYPDYANRLGKLVINDLKAVFGRVSEDKPIKTFGIFDEFTTYAGEQFSTILSRTRSKGMHAIIGSQSYDTIDKISPKLASDLIANCNTYIIHRQNSDIDAEKLADVIGKTISYNVSFSSSASMSYGNSNSTNSQGNSRTYNTLRENRVNSEQIQALKAGYAYVLRKKSGSKVSLVKINFISE